MLYFYLDDLVANAIIVKNHLDGSRKIDIDTAIQYGERVVQELCEKGYYAKIKTINERAIACFEEKYSDFFLPCMVRGRKGYLLQENKGIEDLERVFRKNYVEDVLNCFLLEEVILQSMSASRSFDFQMEDIYCFKNFPRNFSRARFVYGYSENLMDDDILEKMCFEKVEVGYLGSKRKLRK